MYQPASITFAEAALLYSAFIVVLDMHAMGWFKGSGLGDFCREDDKR